MSLSQIANDRSGYPIVGATPQSLCESLPSLWVDESGGIRSAQVVLRCCSRALQVWSAVVPLPQAWTQRQASPAPGPPSPKWVHLAEVQARPRQVRRQAAACRLESRRRAAAPYQRSLPAAIPRQQRRPLTLRQLLRLRCPATSVNCSRHTVASATARTHSTAHRCRW